MSSSSNPKEFVLLTFHADGVTASMRDFLVGLPGATKAGDLSSVKVGDEVSAYWQQDNQWFPATVRRFGEKMMEVDRQKEKDWKKEFVDTEDDDDEEEEDKDGDEEDEEDEESKRKEKKESKKPGKTSKPKALKAKVAKSKKSAQKGDLRDGSMILSKTKSLAGASLHDPHRSSRAESRSISTSRSRSRSRSPSNSKATRSRSRSPRRAHRSRSRSRSRSRYGSGESLHELKKTVESMRKEMEVWKRQQEQERAAEASEIFTLSRR